MPKIIRVKLTQEQRAELNERARTRAVAPRLRERLEMVRLSDLGQTVPQIAQALDLHQQTVRKYLTAFSVGGFAALPDRPIPGRRPTVTRADLDAVDALLDAAAQGERSWTTPQVRHWLATERGRADQYRTPRRAPAARTLPLETHQALGAPPAERPYPPGCGHGPPGVFASLMREAREAAIDLYFLDESGFAPTLPQGYTWARVGTRARVPYVAPQGRRVNVIGALAPSGPCPRLAYQSRTGKIDSAAFLEFLWRAVARLPAAPGHLPAGYHRSRPCVIVLDNYAVHRSAVVKEALPLLGMAGVTFFYLPPYSPELNAIEPLWRHVKHEDMPVRSYDTAEALKAAVDDVLEDHAARLAHSTISVGQAA